MVPLAQALVARGHALRWLTGPDATDRLRHLGIDARPVGIPFEALRGEYGRRYPELRTMPPEQLADHAFPHLFGAVAPEHVIGDVVRVAQDWRPDLVIHDAAEFTGPIAAALVGVPAVTHGFGALTPASRVAAAAEQIAPLWRSVGLEPRPFGGLYDHLYLDPYPARLQTVDMGHVPRRQPARPDAVDEDAEASDVGLEGGPDAPPLVYLTFGTVARVGPAIGIALEAIVARDVRVLVTVGPGGDPADLGPQPSHVRVERYVPQADVLRHCTVVVSHAGSGTFLAAVANGIPQLCLPQAADQFLNADACRHAGVGLALTPNEATVESIGGALDRLLAEASFRDRARSVAREIAAMPGPGEVAALVEALAASDPPLAAADPP